ncbi:MAG: SRPBCC family protein [Gemmatimonadales bacterium]
MPTAPSANRDEIREEVVLRASPGRVRRPLTDCRELVAWWGDPAAYRCTARTLDPRVGGRWRAEGTTAQGGAFHVGGEVLEIDPPSTLAYTWEPSWIDVPPTTVRITLTEAPEGTRLVWRHSGFADYPRALEHHRGGLPNMLRWLARYVDPLESPGSRPRSMPGLEEPL